MSLLISRASKYIFPALKALADCIQEIERLWTYKSYE